jgi:hypothetical protein
MLYGKMEYSEGTVSFLKDYKGIDRGNFRGIWMQLMLICFVIRLLLTDDKDGVKTRSYKSHKSVIFLI